MTNREKFDFLRPIVDRVNRSFCWLKTKDGPRRIAEPLTDSMIADHCAGRRTFGACPIKPGESTTRLALFDLDDHGGTLGFDVVRAAADEIAEAALQYDLHGRAFRSSGGKDIHIYYLWDEAQDAYSVRELLGAVLADCLLLPGTGGLVKDEAEVYPKQNEVPVDGFGSMFVLPSVDRLL